MRVDDLFSMVARPGVVYWLWSLLADERVIWMVFLAERRDRSPLDA